MKKEYLELGKIVNTHGVRGECKVEPWCDSPEFIKQFSTLYLDSRGEQPVRVEAVRIHGGMALLKLCGVDTIEQAQAMKNRMLYLRRSDAPLEPGKYFIEDLLGCRVIDADTGEELGEVREVNNYGASDIWEVLRPNGKKELIPNIPDVVKEICIEQGYVKIQVMKGLFDNAD